MYKTLPDSTPAEKLAKKLCMQDQRELICIGGVFESTRKDQSETEYNCMNLPVAEVRKLAIKVIQMVQDGKIPKSEVAHFNIF